VPQQIGLIRRGKAKAKPGRLGGNRSRRESK
jgi:hypothetical protein